MNIMEHEILEKITKRGGNQIGGIDAVQETDEVLYRRNGSFTIAIIHTTDGEILAVGAAKRHPNDKDKPSLAQQIAFARAVRDKGE